MNRKNMVRIIEFNVFLIVLFIVFPGYGNDLYAELFGKITEERKQAIREDVQKSIREARKLSTKREYADALRLLFDAMYKEERTQLLIALDSDEEFPMVAADEIIKLNKSLIHEDQSPLMQLFRDPDFSLEEKLQYISALRELAARPWWYRKKELFRGKYGGTLVQLMTSRTLNRAEKFDVLYWIESTVQKEYTSAAQRDQIKKEIAQLQRSADQKLRERRYIDVFLLLSEAEQKLVDGLFYAQDHTTYKQVDRSVELYVQSDESSLMKLFKNPGISVTERENVLTDLKIIAKRSRIPTDTLLLRGKTYDGTLIQIMSNPKVSWLIKLDILRYFKKQIQKEIAQLPDLAEQKLEEHHYLEAFILLSEAAEQEADDNVLLKTIFQADAGGIMLMNPEDPLGKQVVQGIELFGQSEISPLMNLLKNPQIADAEKQTVFSELRWLAEHSEPTTDNVFVQENYDDPLVQIFSHPMVHSTIKTMMWLYIGEMLEK